jgi:N-carbamoyl-L-amino-acid hydrolase
MVEKRLVDEVSRGEFMEKIEPNIDRVRRDIERLSEFTSPAEPGYTRISFSKEDRQAREYVAALMRDEARLNLRIDAVGNLIGRRGGEGENPAILIGSHIDTVRGGGMFDGVAGVIAGIEVARGFEERGIRTAHPLEVIVFLAEEPSPFGISTVGSRGMAGKLSEEHLTSLKDAGGRTLGAAIHEMGGDPEKIAEAKRSPHDALAYLELHIEQGPQLFSRGIPIGVVTGIVGISRGRIEVAGRYDHSGTTPMDVRKDALAAASEIVLALESTCMKLDGVVGTIGKIDVYPNSLNVIPGVVHLGMEVRSLSESTSNRAISLFKEELEGIRDRRGIEINFESGVSSKPVMFDSKMVDRINRACDSLNIAHLEISSGAGHDANHIAEVTSAGMVFVPSKDGRSHCPEEFSTFEDICLGTGVIAGTIARIDTEEVT